MRAIRQELESAVTSKMVASGGEPLAQPATATTTYETPELRLVRRPDKLTEFVFSISLIDADALGTSGCGA